jgi:hypothetical protein
LTTEHEELAPRTWGRDRGLLQIPDDFDASLPEDILALFERDPLVSADPAVLQYDNGFIRASE